MKYQVYTYRDDFTETPRIVHVEADGFNMEDVSGIPHAIFWNDGVEYVHLFRCPDAIILVKGDK